MQASQLFIGDALDLYATMRTLDEFTVTDLAKASGLHARWLREWCSQQAAMGVLVLLPGEAEDDASLRFRLLPAYADVLGDPAHAQ